MIVISVHSSGHPRRKTITIISQKKPTCSSPKPFTKSPRSFEPPSSAKTPEKRLEPMRSQPTIADVRIVRKTDSFRFANESRRYSAASIRPPSAPSAAASVGVAIPKRIESRTAAMRSEIGTRPFRSMTRIVPRGKSRSSFGSAGATSFCT
jgi:hypothetical protein